MRHQVRAANWSIASPAHPRPEVLSTRGLPLLSNFRWRNCQLRLKSRLPLPCKHESFRRAAAFLHTRSQTPPDGHRACCLIANQRPN